MSKVLQLKADPECPQLTSLQLQRALLGQLEPQELGHVNQHIAVCKTCTARRADIEADKAAFQTLMPFARFAEDHAQRRQGQRGLARIRQSQQRLWWAALATAALASSVLLFSLGDPFAPTPRFITQSKGDGVQFAFVVKSEATARRGNNGEPLPSGAQIQFLLRAHADARSMVLVGIDGNAAVTVYAAEALSEASKGEGTLQPLAESIVLDEALGPERFFVVLSPDTDVDMLHQQVQAAASRIATSKVDLTTLNALPLDNSQLRQDSVFIVKVER
jgi:anti-sigma factor RsiW